MPSDRAITFGWNIPTSASCDDGIGAIEKSWKSGVFLGECCFYNRVAEIFTARFVYLFFFLLQHKNCSRGNCNVTDATWMSWSHHHIGYEWIWSRESKQINEFLHFWSKYFLSFHLTFRQILVKIVANVKIRENFNVISRKMAIRLFHVNIQAGYTRIRKYYAPIFRPLLHYPLVRGVYTKLK